MALNLTKKPKAKKTAIKPKVGIGGRKIRPRALKQAPEILQPGRSVRAQSREAFAAEIRKRTADQVNPKNTILNPDEVAGDYILSRGLFTTLSDGRRNGTRSARLITLEDLKTFSANIRGLKTQAAKAHMAGGIKAKQVIDKSWHDDLQRAKAQIHIANPTNYKAVTEGGGQGTALMVHFMTNAGPESDFSHHNVNIQFLDFGSAVASAEKADKAADALLKGRLKFECNCGRFKYFFRYVCTQAEIVCGRLEFGYPKIKNPGLTGISCKHGLRVMQTIVGSPTLRRYMANVIQKFRDDIGHTEHVEKIKDQREFERKRQKETSRQRSVRTTDEKREARARSDQAYRAKQRTVAKEAQKSDKARASAFKGLEKSLRQLQQLGQITQEQFDTMLKTAKG